MCFPIMHDNVFGPTVVLCVLTFNMCEVHSRISLTFSEVISVAYNFWLKFSQILLEQD